MSLRNAFFAILVSAIWGSNFVAAKASLEYFPPFLLTALRFLIVALVLIPLFPIPTRAQMLRIVPIAVLSALQFSLFFVALDMGLDISTSAIVGQLGVPFSCLLSWIFFKDRLGPWRIAGIATAFLGIAVIAGTPNISGHWAAFFVAVTTSVFWSAANILIKYLKDVKPMVMLAWMSLFSVPVLLALSVALEWSRWPELTGAPMTALAGLAYTIVASTIIAYGLWYYLLSRCDVSQVTPYSLLTPVFAMVCGHAFYDEPMTAAILTGAFLTIAGVGIIVVRRPKLAEKGAI
jgi:O-acetylserine/cysteine efflux transporter